jgi:hypothetical protein
MSAKNYQQFLESQGALDRAGLWWWNGNLLGATPRAAAQELSRIEDALAARDERESWTEDFKVLKRLADHRSI